MNIAYTSLFFSQLIKILKIQMGFHLHSSSDYDKLYEIILVQFHIVYVNVVFKIRTEEKKKKEHKEEMRGNY